MKRILTILGLACVVVILAGFRGAGYRADRTLYGDYMFTESVDVDSLNADHLVVNDTIIVADHITPSADTTSKFGAATKRIKETWALRYMGTDGTKADTFSFFDDGSYAKWDADNTKAFMTGATYRFLMSGNNFSGGSDTTQTSGTDATRWKESWALRHCWTDGTKADSGKVYDDGTNTVVQTDNEVKFSNSVMFGGVGVAIDSIIVSNDSLLFYVDGTVYGAVSP
jgi:hypothetical protein